MSFKLENYCENFNKLSNSCFTVSKKSRSKLFGLFQGPSKKFFEPPHLFERVEVGFFFLYIFEFLGGFRIFFPFHSRGWKGFLDPLVLQRYIWLKSIDIIQISSGGQSLARNFLRGGFLKFLYGKIWGGGFLGLFFKNPSKLKKFFHRRGDLSHNSPFCLCD